MVGFYKKNDWNRLFEMSADLMCIASEEGRLEQINPSFSKILGYSEQEILATSFTDFVHPEDLEEALEALERYSIGEKINRLELRFQKKSGEYKWLSWQFIPRPLDYNFIGIARDISNFKQASIALAESERHLNELINDVFKYEKVGEKEGLRSTYMELMDIVGKVELSIQNLLQDKAAKLVYHNLPIVHTNEPVIFIVLKNLIEKSLSHNNNAFPCIEIRYHQSRSKHYISIKDNNRKESAVPNASCPGLQHLHADQSFQSDDMALILTQKLIERIDGQIAFSPATNEMGCIFQISFPITGNRSLQDPPLVIHL